MDRRIARFVAIVLLTLVGCADDDTASESTSTTSSASSTITTATTTPSTTTTPITPTTIAPSTTSTAVPPATDDVGATVADPELRVELLEMLVQDQAVRTGIAPPGDDRTEDELFDSMGSVDAANKARLTEIFEAHDWPGWVLVGHDGSTAAWAIVQHQDLDLAYQERGLALLQAAVDAGDASKGDLAYLTDRVQVAKGLPQTYGTQWSPNEKGEWLPRTPIADEANVDARRADAGLGTIAEYLVELQEFFES